MRKYFKNLWIILVIVLGICVFGDCNTLYAASIVDVPINVTYGQTEARSIYQMINDMRTSSTDAWYWAPSNKEKIECSGLKELMYSYDLERVAMKRAAEIALSYNRSHMRTDGTVCFTAYDEEGLYYMAAGENIAYGQESAVAVNRAWREDNENYQGQGHRRSMLSDEFDSVGIGHVYYNGTHYWVEEFADLGFAGSEVAANDSETTVDVRVDSSKILGWNVGATESYNKYLTCGQTVTLPKYVIMLQIADHRGYGNGCPIDSEVSYSLVSNENASLNGKLLTVRGNGSVEVLVTSGELQETLTYTVSHNVKILPRREATEYQTGLTEGRQCEGCGEIIVAQKEIPKLVPETKPEEETKPDLEAKPSTAAKKYKISKTTASLKKGKTLTLKVSASKGKVKWSSSNTKIATVNSKGVVTAKKKGTVTIKAYCSSLKKTVKCNIEVYDKISQAQVTKKILKLKSKYKEGRYWTNENNYYFWGAIRCHCYGCIAFVGEVSDQVFGKNAKVTQHTSFSKIKAGDHIRIGGYHSVIVISKKGDKLTVAEGNYNSSVHWGRIITKKELAREDFYVETRY